MKSVKPLAVLLLLGVANLAACGKPDTVQESELQPPEPRQAEREQLMAATPAPASQAQEQPICRNLREGDPWYPRWTYCCDTADRTQSFWTGGPGFPTGTWTGSCASFGLR